jgi:hypothetical protein
MGRLISDAHTDRVASLYWDLYGTEAVHRALVIANRMDGIGDTIGADVWRSVSRRIIEMGKRSRD